jgi:hypothetical protein
MQGNAASYFQVEGTVHAELLDCGYRTITDETVERTPLDSDIRPRLVSAVMTSADAPELRIIARVWDVVYSPSRPGVPAGHVDADVLGLPRVSKASIVFGAEDGNSADLELTCE